MGKIIMEIISWTIIAAILVLIIMNASKFATAIGSITTPWLAETSMFTGSGYKCPPGQRMDAKLGCVA